jgi:hypothetical protein
LGLKLVPGWSYQPATMMSCVRSSIATAVMRWLPGPPMVKTRLTSPAVVSRATKASSAVEESVPTAPNAVSPLKNPPATTCRKTAVDSPSSSPSSVVHLRSKRAAATAFTAERVPPALGSKYVTHSTVAEPAAHADDVSTIFATYPESFSATYARASSAPPP